MDTIVREKPVQLIMGSDWWTDCDDAVAMRILARAHKLGLVEILGIGINACMAQSVVSLDAFMRHEGLPDLAIGIDREAVDYGGKPPYQARLAAMPSKYTSNDDCEDAVRLYRRILTTATEKIDIAEIGFLQVLANLLMSPPDDVSPLSGAALVAQKVDRLWAMAGKWNDLENGVENNFARTPRAKAAAHYVCKHWPTAITFLGWEAANEVITGGELAEGDVLHQVLCDFGSPKGRASWDPMLVLLACIHDEGKAGYRTVQGTASVHPETGVNGFQTDANGLHRFVIKNHPNEYYAQAINRIIGVCNE